MYAKSTRPSAKREVQKERSTKRDVQKFRSAKRDDRIARPRRAQTWLKTCIKKYWNQLFKRKYIMNANICIQKYQALSLA